MPKKDDTVRSKKKEDLLRIAMGEIGRLKAEKERLRKLLGQLEDGFGDVRLVDWADMQARDGWLRMIAAELEDK